MSPPLQAKLLQVLQDAEFTRLGGNREVRVDVRVVCATNRELDEMVQREGLPRGPLLPAQRGQRRDPAAARTPRGDPAARRALPAALLRSRYGKPADRAQRPPDAGVPALPLPGQRPRAREHDQAHRRARERGSRSSPRCCARARRARQGRRAALLDWIEEIEETAGEIPLREVGRRAALEAERETIDRVLHHTNWNRKQAARLLGVSYKTLLQKIRGCGLEPS